MSLLDMITGHAGQEVASEAHHNFGVSKNQVIALLAVAAPLVISYLRKKAEHDPAEADALNNALEKDHDGSILNNPAQAKERQTEGGSILDHIFGSEKGAVENQLAGKTGISMDKIGPVLAMLAPLIMGYLGKQKRDNGVSSGGGLGDLLGGILGNAQSQAQPGNPLNDILGNVLGGGGQSGNPLNDILGSVMGGGGKQQGGLGGVLGSLLGGK